MLNHASAFSLCVMAVALLSAPVWSEQSTGRLTAQLAVLRDQGVNLIDKKNIRIEGVTVVNTLKKPAAAKLYKG